MLIDEKTTFRSNNDVYGMDVGACFTTWSFARSGGARLSRIMTDSRMNKKIPSILVTAISAKWWRREHTGGGGISLDDVKVIPDNLGDLGGSGMIGEHNGNSLIGRLVSG